MGKTTSIRVRVKPQVYQWAIKRSQVERDKLHYKFPKLNDWLTENKQPTFKQLETFAKAVFLPTATLLLAAPAEEKLPIADFRTFRPPNRQASKSSTPTSTSTPSPHLLDTIYSCQLKQEWYSNHCRLQGEGKNKFVGRFSLQTNPMKVAHAIHEQFPFFKHPSQSQNQPNAQTAKQTQYKYKDHHDAFRRRKEAIEDCGILVMTSGVVRGNTHRPLNINEFRGFTLVDEYAPLIFVNAKDTVAAKSFTLIHELAHLALGKSGISNDSDDQQTEKWCNQVASEVLIPEEYLRRDYDKSADKDIEIQKLAQLYKVSTLAILMRLKNTRLLDVPQSEFGQIYNDEKERIRVAIAKNLQMQKTNGGNFYNSKPAAISKRFLSALVFSTLEGNTLYRDAMNLADVKKMKTFKNLSDRVLAG